MHRLIDLKFQRTVEEKNRDYLRKINLLSLESLRVLSNEFNIDDFNDSFLRLHELFFMNAMSLARLHSELLTQERYNETREVELGKQYGWHLYFSQIALLSIAVKLQNAQKHRFSLKLPSVICQDNMQQIQGKLDELTSQLNSHIWEDMANAIDDEYYTKGKIHEIVSLADLLDPDSADFEVSLANCI